MVGRPKLNQDEETKARKVKAPASWWQRVDDAAREAGLSAAEFIRRIIDERLKG